MYIAVIILGICYLCGANCGNALAICSIILGVFITIKNISIVMEK
jgi:hypothetical protein